jgi:hypothetical protein
MLRRHFVSVVAALTFGWLPGQSAAETESGTNESADAGTDRVEQAESDTVRLDIVCREE